MAYFNRLVPMFKAANPFAAGKGMYTMPSTDEEPLHTTADRADAAAERYGQMAVWHANQGNAIYANDPTSDVAALHHSASIAARVAADTFSRAGDHARNGATEPAKASYNAAVDMAKDANTRSKATDGFNAKGKLEKGSEDQPRDERGRFAVGNGTTASDADLAAEQLRQSLEDDENFTFAPKDKFNYGQANSGVSKSNDNHGPDGRFSSETQTVESKVKQSGLLYDHPYHDKTDAELTYIGRDAHAAASANPGGRAELKYLDQANDSASIRYARDRLRAKA